MQPKLVDVFENGQITLKVYELPDGTRRHWLFAGSAALELDHDAVDDLDELIHAFCHDYGQFDYRFKYGQAMAGFIAGVTLFVLVFLMFGGYNV